MPLTAVDIAVLIGCCCVGAAAQTTSMTFTEHKGQLCVQQDIPNDVKCNNQNDESKCWSYWSDTDTLEQCKYQCAKHRCECLGYKPDDTGYFHKCRMLLPGKWAHKTKGSSVDFTACARLCLRPYPGTHPCMRLSLGGIYCADTGTSPTMTGRQTSPTPARGWAARFWCW
jgi:hypothetical protein